MSIIRASNSCLGLGNQTFPLWDYGASLYWRSAEPLIIQTPGGVGNYSYTYSGTDPYYNFVPGKGYFEQVNPTVLAKFPPSGFVAPSRDNYFDNSQSANRSFTSIDVGLVTSTPALSSGYILDLTSTGLVNGFRVANATGSSKRFLRSDTSSATFSRAFSVLLKRSDGGVVNGSVATIIICLVSGGPSGPNIASSTVYKKIRDDGWYELTASIPAQGGTPLCYYGVELANTFTVDVEAPGLESFGTSIGAGTNPPPHLGTTPSSAVHQLSFARGSFDAEPFPNGGWMAGTIVYPYAASDFTLPASVLISWEVDDLDFIRLEISNTYQQIVSEMDSGGVSQFYLRDTTGNPEFVIGLGVVHGVVISWRRRRTTDEAIMFINGIQADIETGWTLPVGIPDRIRIGYKGTATSPATCWVQHAAIGYKPISRADARALSIWFKKQGFSTIA